MTREEHAKLTRDMAYAERVGKVYKDFRVEKVEWDGDKKKQVWTLRCVHCGALRVTTSWQNYSAGKSGVCKRCSWKQSAWIGKSVLGWHVNRHWVDDSGEHIVEIECEKCGEVQFAPVSDLVCSRVICGTCNKV